MKPFRIPSFMSIGTTVIELREFKEKKKMKKDEEQHGQRTKWEKSLIGGERGILVKYTQFVMTFYAIKSSEVKLTYKS